MRVKFILPALTEATSQFYRPIKYSLFPPLGLTSLAAFLSPADEAYICDEHTETLSLDDTPDLVVIQVYITNAYRAYEIADTYRARGVHVCLGGLHVTSLPEEAASHADTIFLGPGEQTFPQFLKDFAAKAAGKVYRSTDGRTLLDLPPPRRDLIRRERYLVPNSIVVSRGCPHHCDFCYKDAFFENGKSFYVQEVDAALREIESLPGRHLYFLDDHILGNRRFASTLFDAMKGMNRVFQGASTVEAVLRGNLIEKAAEAGLRSVFIGFETLSPQALASCNKKQNLAKDYEQAIRRLDSLGIMINGSFVFGLDGDDADVFDRTVDWAGKNGITTATFHVATPYPGTAYHRKLESENRIVTRNWDLYDTRHAVFQPIGLSADALEAGYRRAYRDFYTWGNIARGALTHTSAKHKLKHLAYASAWKKFEPIWNLIIIQKMLPFMTPALEAILSKVSRSVRDSSQSAELPADGSATGLRT